MKFLIPLVSLSLVFICGCGSGGGDGGGSRGSARTGARVLNTAIDLPPVSLSTSAKVGETISTVKFAEATGFAELPEGEQTISVQSVDGASGPFKFSVSIQNQDRPQILVYGLRETNGINATLLEFKKLEIPDGFAAVRIAHGAAGAATIQGSVGVSELPAVVSFGSASKYLFVATGTTLVKLTRSADSKVITNQQVQVDNRKAYTFVVSGELDYLVIGSLLED